MSLLWYNNDPFDYLWRRPVCPAAWDPEDLISPLELYCNLVQQPRRKEQFLTRRGADVAVDKDQFRVNLDVQHFKPEEITVKVRGNDTVTIEGKHEEKPDEHGYISRHFVRRYVLPEGHDIAKVESKLSSDGVLTITAPKVKEGVEARTIPIARTGEPSKLLESKPEEQENKPEEQENKLEKEENKTEEK